MFHVKHVCGSYRGCIHGPSGWMRLTVQGNDGRKYGHLPMFAAGVPRETVGRLSTEYDAPARVDVSRGTRVGRGRPGVQLIAGAAQVGWDEGAPSINLLAFRSGLAHAMLPAKARRRARAARAPGTPSQPGPPGQPSPWSAKRHRAPSHERANRASATGYVSRGTQQLAGQPSKLVIAQKPIRVDAKSRTYRCTK